MAQSSSYEKSSWETHDADKLDPEGLELLYEPNEDLYLIDKTGQKMIFQPDRVCALDKMAQIGNDYILIAERGVGKTHILNLIRDKIKEAGGHVIEINPKKPENNPYKRYPQIESRYKKDKKEDIWKYVILEAIERDTNIQAANMMKLALFTGMRRGEMFKLKWKDIDFNRGFINIKDPKGGPDQKIPLNDAARDLLKSHPRTKSQFVL